jgi:hypothetical protein
MVEDAGSRSQIKIPVEVERLFFCRRIASVAAESADAPVFAGAAACYTYEQQRGFRKA